MLPPASMGAGRMDLGLAGRVALVPLGTAGIGFGAATELAKEGARLAISGRDATKLAETEARLRALGAPDVLAFHGDATEAAAAEAFVRAAGSRFGGAIDILIANSPGAPSRPFLELTDEAWRAAFEVKFVMAMRLARLVMPGMTARKWGRIIFIAGTHGRQPHAHALTAGMNNAAIISVAKGLAEVGAPHNVLVTTVNPGPFDTERMRYLAERKSADEGIPLDAARATLTEETLLRRFGRVEEVGSIIALLASERGGYMTGTFVDVDGGQTKAW